MEERPEPAKEESLPSSSPDVGLVGLAAVVGAFLGFALGSSYDGWAQSLAVVFGALSAGTLASFLPKRTT